MTLEYWDPEDNAFWAKKGKNIAYYNLTVSTFALLIGFAIWAQWGGIAKNVIAAHKKDSSVYSFGYTNKKDHAAAVKLLAPLGSISGATSRIVHTFAVNPCGGRNTNLGSIICIMLAMFTGGFTLLNGNCNLSLLYLAAILSGIGGGIFSSSVNNISFFSPDRLQGTFLAIDAGFGNIGVAIQAQLVPRLSKLGACFAGIAGTCESKPLGLRYVWNPCFFWGVLATSLVYPVAKMNNMPKHGKGAKCSGSDELTRLGRLCEWFGTS